MKILAIGNSFSQDATRYLHDIGKSANTHLEVTNLYIGGCPLERHYCNIKGDYRKYSLEYNGHETGFPVSIKEALLNRCWDVVTIQQASMGSFKYEYYQPYLNFCADYIREMCPGAKFYLHHTWSYQNGSKNLAEWTNFKTSEEMFKSVHECYLKAFEDCGADGMIPSGEVMIELERMGYTIHRDGFHATYGLGRYALGLTWFAYTTGKSIDNISFSYFDEPVSQKEISDAKSVVKKVLGI